MANYEGVLSGKYKVYYFNLKFSMQPIAAMLNNFILQMNKTWAFHIQADMFPEIIQRIELSFMT